MRNSAPAGPLVEASQMAPVGAERPSGPLAQPCLELVDAGGLQAVRELPRGFAENVATIRDRLARISGCAQMGRVAIDQVTHPSWSPGGHEKPARYHGRVTRWAIGSGGDGQQSAPDRLTRCRQAGAP